MAHPLTEDRSSPSNSTQLTDVTGPNWDGLPCCLCVAPEPRRQLQFDTTESMLALHVESGRHIQVSGGGKTWQYTAAEHRFDYTPAGHYNAQNWGPATQKCYVFRIPAEFERSVLDERGSSSPLIARWQFADRRLESLARSALSGAIRGNLSSSEAVLLSASIVDRLHELSTPAAEQEGPLAFSQTTRRLIVEYLDMHLDSNSDIEEIGFLTGLARTQSGKAFRGSFGVPIHEYLIRRRIELALEKLSSTPAPVTQVAHDLGFSSHAHFTTVFKARVGMTPSAYRAQQQRRLDAGLSRDDQGLPEGMRFDAFVD